MFTGLVEEVGKLKSFTKRGDSMVLTIEAKDVLLDAAIGDSIAVNGICLTVTSFNNASFTVDVMPETMYRSNLKDLQVGSKVNLERAMSPNKRFGGHFVAGHVDGVATLIEKKPIDNAIYFKFKTDSSLASYMIEKGSIAIDGISLTLVEVTEDTFSVSIIPHTLEKTNLLTKQIKDTINVEVDMIGKFVEKAVTNILTKKDSKLTNISEGFLKENGFY